MREALHDGGLLEKIVHVRGGLVGVGAQALDGHLDGHLSRGARRARARRAAVRRGGRRALVLAAGGRGGRGSGGSRRSGCGGGGGPDGRAGEERAPDLAELARAEALLEVQTRERYLPAVLRALTQVRHQRTRPRARAPQRAAQAVRALCTPDQTRSE